MKLELKRIEATLQQLAAQNAATGNLSSSWEENYTKGQASSSPIQKSDPQGETKEPHALSPTPKVSFFPLQQASDKKTPTLPKVKQPSFSSHRNAVNPHLPMSLLKEIETTVAGWQSEHKQILQQIQDVYLEGPITEGWLESIEDGKPQAEARMNSTLSTSSFFPGYRLCGLDADGKLWSRSIPPQQLPSVSLAIARYQKLRQLLSRKQELENRLSQLAEILVFLQGHLQKL
jgi:hypothetical protein